MFQRASLLALPALLLVFALAWWWLMPHGRRVQPLARSPHLLLIVDENDTALLSQPGLSTLHDPLQLKEHQLLVPRQFRWPGKSQEVLVYQRVHQFDQLLMTGARWLKPGSSFLLGRQAGQLLSLKSKLAQRESERMPARALRLEGVLGAGGVRLHLGQQLIELKAGQSWRGAFTRQGGQAELVTDQHGFKHTVKRALDQRQPLSVLTIYDAGLVQPQGRGSNQGGARP